MTAKNDITGDVIKSRSTSDAYRDNWDRIFKDKKKFERLSQESERVNKEWEDTLTDGLDEDKAEYRKHLEEKYR